jgi:phage-related minor tail protein
MILGVQKVILDIQKMILDAQKVILDIQKMILDIQKTITDISKTIADVRKTTADIGRIANNARFSSADAWKSVQNFYGHYLFIGKGICFILKRLFICKCFMNKKRRSLDGFMFFNNEIGFMARAIKYLFL